MDNDHNKFKCGQQVIIEVNGIPTVATVQTEEVSYFGEVREDPSHLVEYILGRFKMYGHYRESQMKTYMPKEKKQEEEVTQEELF